MKSRITIAAPRVARWWVVESLLAAFVATYAACGDGGGEAAGSSGPTFGDAVAANTHDAGLCAPVDVPAIAKL